ncbi:MAG: hypothetical protein IKP88_02835 [Lachnospiraceae bacterium]|nr:hypothetical protein [Lachnospiraceae bacterium]
MGGIAYLLLCFLTGFSIIELLFKDFDSFTEYSFGGKHIHLSSLFLRLPVYFVTGVLVMTWPLYILACIFRNTGNPLGIANAIVMITAAVFSGFSIFRIYFRNKKKIFKDAFQKISIVEMVIVTLITLLVFYIMFESLGMVDGKLKIGLSVFSDFSTHLSMMRSFSHMGNFPTYYTFFGGEDVKYHFMFQFLCGNLEFLGLRLDLALNIPSILSMIFSYFMLYVLAVKLCGKRSIGIITLLLYTFRSSSALLDYIVTLPKGQIYEILSNKEICEFIGSTNHEDWGLWNLNVYCNQRHLSFSLIIMLFVIMLMLPRFYEAGQRISAYLKENGSGVKNFFKSVFLDKEGWLVKDYKICIFAGLILGLSGFFNGAVLIGTVIVLFFLAAGSDRRLEYVILAGIAGILSLIQSKCFISTSLFSPQYFYGFLSEPNNFFGALDFVKKMMGILPLVLLIQFVRVKSLHKYIMFSFSMPIIFAFTVSLTPDIAVNHKYVMISIMLLDIYAASLLISLFERKDIWYRLLGVLTALSLIATGFFEFIILSRKNVDERAILYTYEDEIMNWIWDNATNEDIFLTANYYLTFSGYGNSVVLSGAQLYNGWEYFSWSAGYDVGVRDDLEIRIYEAESPEEIYELVEEAGIRYLVVDRFNRDTDMYFLNEEVIDDSFECVYRTGSDEDMFSIYDVQKRLR